jgi:hypothetical protein
VAIISAFEVGQMRIKYSSDNSEIFARLKERGAPDAVYTGSSWNSWNFARLLNLSQEKRKGRAFEHLNACFAIPLLD